MNEDIEKNTDLKETAGQISQLKDVKKYNRIKIFVGLAEMGIIFAFLLIILFAGFSERIRDFVQTVTVHRYAQLYLFFANCL